MCTVMIHFSLLDLNKLYWCQDLNPTRSPKSLQAKVMFDIRFYFARRGAENFKEMTVNSFRIEFDQTTNLHYIVKNLDELQKNHKETDNEIISGYMPELPYNVFCPVDSFRKYMAHLHPENNWLWQTPIGKPKTNVWYASTRVGDHPLSDFMKNLSKSAQLSQKYTNHDIRVTGCSILHRAKFSDKQIMSITGHKSIESLKIYKRVSGQEKIRMGCHLAFALQNVNALPEPLDLDAEDYDEQIREILGPAPAKQRRILPKPTSGQDQPQPKRSRNALQEIAPNIQAQAIAVQPQIHTPAVPQQQIVPVQQIPVPVAPQDLQIEDEYGVDLLNVLAEYDPDLDGPLQAPAAPATPQPAIPFNAVVPQKPNANDNNQVVNTANNTFNMLQNQNAFPGFSNCHIGTINFNVIHK